MTTQTLKAFDDMPPADSADEAYAAEFAYITKAETLTAQINQAYGRLHDAREALYEAAEVETQRTQALDDAERSLLLSGAIDGKNAEVRAAQMFNRTETERALLGQSRSVRRRAELNFQIAQDEVQRLRTIVALITSQN